MNAIEPASQLIIFPDFDRMAITQIKKLAIKCANGLVDPGADAPGSQGAATLDHGVEIAIDPHFKCFSLDDPLQAF